MSSIHSENQASLQRTYLVTGPTSGIGKAAAFELARLGTVILVGRDKARLEEVRKGIERKGGSGIPVVCDLADPQSVRRATDEIIALKRPIVGLLNNAGIMQQRPTKSALGWDMSFATNHLGPFAFTEALLPHLPDGASVLFVASAVEDPERKPAAAFGFRGGRYLSAEASARGEWKPGGSVNPGIDAYATSKQCSLATALVFARENPRLHVNALEPGVTPATSLGRDVGPFARLLMKLLVPVLVPLLLPFVKFLSTPKRAARVITRILTDDSDQTGIYFDERGEPKELSAQMRETGFAERVVAETRELLFAVHS